MSKPELDRRSLLAALPAAALGSSLAGQRTGSLRPHSRLDVGPAKGREVRNLVEARCVEEVCTALALELPVLTRPYTADDVRRAVQAAYAKVQEAALGVGYAWIFIEGRWVLWCYETTTFTLEFTREESVRVTLEEWQPLTG